MEIPPVYVSQVGGGLEVNLHVKVNSLIKVVQHILHVLLFQVENPYIDWFFNHRVVTLVAENSGCKRLLWYAKDNLRGIWLINNHGNAWISCQSWKYSCLW